MGEEDKGAASVILVRIHIIHLAERTTENQRRKRLYRGVLCIIVIAAAVITTLARFRTDRAAFESPSFEKVRM